MAQRRVTFQFPKDTQTRYVNSVPAKGDRVRGLDGETYVVSSVIAEGVSFIARCVTTADYERAARAAE